MEKITLKANCYIVLCSKNGKVKTERHIHNTTTNAGKYAIAAQLLASPDLGNVTHMAIGTGSPSGTALGTELDRNAVTSKTRTNGSVTIIGNWAAADGTGTLTEAGLFDQGTLGGNMWCSSSFTAIVKGASDTLAITWIIIIA